MAETPIWETIELSDRKALLIWWHLVYDGARGFGIGQENLIKNTGCSTSELYSVLVPLLERGILEHRLQQVGTGGTRDHFYRLKELRKIVVVPAKVDAA